MDCFDRAPRISVDLDGCQGGRLGRDSKARQGSGDQCALVQRSAIARILAATTIRSRISTQPNWRRMPNAYANLSTNASGIDQGQYLYDVVDTEGGGNDAACRPNQLLSISLKHPVLDPSRWERVVAVAKERLLTPYGLRSLAPGHPDYKSHYYGDLRSRDAAYHQGTVWAWLIGPFVDAWLKVYPDDRAGARKFVEGFDQQMQEGAVGTISEIFDAEAPFHQRGCIAQAWSVAEALRCWVKTAD